MAEDAVSSEPLSPR